MAIHPSALLCLHILPCIKDMQWIYWLKTTGAPQTLQLKPCSRCTAEQRWNSPDAPLILLSLLHPFSLSVQPCLTLLFSLSSRSVHFTPLTCHPTGPVPISVCITGSIARLGYLNFIFIVSDFYLFLFFNLLWLVLSS